MSNRIFKKNCNFNELYYIFKNDILNFNFPENGVRVTNGFLIPKLYFYDSNIIHNFIDSWPFLDIYFRNYFINESLNYFNDDVTLVNLLIRVFKLLSASQGYHLKTYKDDSLYWVLKKKSKNPNMIDMSSIKINRNNRKIYFY